MEIPHLAFLSVIFGLMLLSFPIGMFVVFHTDIGDTINFALPFGILDKFEHLDLGFPYNMEIGDAFVAIWSLYAIFFTIAMLGPKTGFIKAMSSIFSHGSLDARSNYMVAITKWLSITILVSVIINFVQEGFGITIDPPAVENDLIQFFYVSLSPLIEEAGFRLLLIGLPLFAFYGYNSNIKHLLQSLWNPSSALHIHDIKKAVILIVVVGVLFGFAHISSDMSWSEGKFAQAAAGGMILGWVYFRFGFVAALMIHWATNYFVFSYVNFLAQVNNMTVDAAFSHPLISTIEALLLISGSLSVAMIIAKYWYSRKSILEI